MEMTTSEQIKIIFKTTYKLNILDLIKVIDDYFLQLEKEKDPTEIKKILAAIVRANELIRLNGILKQTNKTIHG